MCCNIEKFSGSCSALKYDKSSLPSGRSSCLKTSNKTGLFTMTLNSSIVRTCTQTGETSETLVSVIFATNSRAAGLNLAITEVNNPNSLLSKHSGGINKGKLHKAIVH